MIEHGRVLRLAVERYNEHHRTCGVVLRIPPRAKHYANAEGFRGRRFIWPSIDVRRVDDRRSRVDTSLFFDGTGEGRAAFEAWREPLLDRLAEAGIGGEVREMRIGTIGTACAVGVSGDARTMPAAALADRLARQFAAMLDAVRDIIEGHGPPGPGEHPPPPLGGAPGFVDPLNDEDARRRIDRSVALRQGQPAFRDRLLELHGRRCAITGCDVEAVLEAAHIRPYRGAHTNHESNGLLLRADLHTLLDRNLIAIDPDTLRVVVAPSARGSSYGALHGERLRARTAGGPSADALRLGFEEFKRLHGM